MDKIIRFICYKLLPKKILYYAYIKVAAEVTSGEYSNTVVTDITMIEAIERFGNKYNINKRKNV